MGAQAWIIRITGGLVRRTGFIARLIIANSPFTRVTADRQACGLSLHYKRLSLPPLLEYSPWEKNPPSNLLWSCFATWAKANIQPWNHKEITAVYIYFYINRKMTQFTAIPFKNSISLFVKHIYNISLITFTPSCYAVSSSTVCVCVKSVYCMCYSSRQI